MIENQNLLNLLKNIGKEDDIKNHLFVYYGKMNLDVIISTIQVLESKMIMENFSKALISKAKMLCVEILQNIVKHQEKHDSIFPYFVVGTKDNRLKISTGNVVSLSDKKVIEEKLNELSLMDKDLIEKNYKIALKENHISKEGNVGLGLIDIVYRSNKNVNYSMHDLPNNLFSFSLDVLIN